MKIVKEVLTLFKVKIDEDAENCDWEKLSVANEAAEADGREKGAVKTVLSLEDKDRRISFGRVSKLHEDESEKAGLNRLIKLNLYHIFVEELGYKEAPWGILHGVRPTKIVQRLIEQGLSREEISARFRADYEVSLEKAELLLDIAYLQMPFLRKAADPYLISVYIGVPFCSSRCLYCSFPSGILPGADTVRRYLQVLSFEMAKAKQLIDEYGFKVQSIYVGGGTPTSLGEGDFDDLLSLAAKYFKSEYLEEFTVEAGRPDSITSAKAKSIVKCGAERVSVNPQTMQDRTLRAIGRRHTSEDIKNAFSIVRRAGINHINADLIIGLPGEDEKDADDTINKVVDLAPEDITLHALALKRGSQLKLIKDDIVLPDDETVINMSRIMTQAVADYGLKPYYLYRQGYMSGQLENVGYSRPGCEGIYNIQMMGERQTVLGIGAAATSKIAYPQKRLHTSFNAKDLHTYLSEAGRYIQRRETLLKEAYKG